MKYAGILEDDFVNGEGVCVSYWAQGCNLRCKGCHNPQTWDFEGGKEDSEDNIIAKILYYISKNGVQRNLSLLGGEPLCPENIEFIRLLVYWVKSKYPDIKIFIWSGYEMEELKKRIEKNDRDLKFVLDNSYMLACGPFIEEKRDITLKYVGSTNQKILYKGRDY